MTLQVQAFAAVNEILGSDSSACETEAAGPAVLLHVTGFKDRSGRVRVELYPPTQADFVAPGARLRAEGKTFKRIDTITPQSGDAVICVALPGPGQYAIAVMHDRDADGHLDVFSDGFGFPNNPKIGLGIPDVNTVVVNVRDGVVPFNVILNYWSGFGARPVKPH